MGGLFPINPAGPGEGFSSFNGCSSSMYRALHTAAGTAPGAAPGLAGAILPPGAGLDAQLGAVPGWGWKLFSPPASPGDLPVQDLCLCPLCVGGELCSVLNVPGGLGGCSPPPPGVGGVGGLKPLPPSLPLAAAPSSFPRRRGGGQRVLRAVLPLPGPRVARGGSPGRGRWVGLGYLLPMG